MKTTGADNTLQAAMHDRACQWIARLRADDVSEQDREAFALWLAANPAHRAAMDDMLELWEDLEILKYQPEKPARTSRRRWLGTGIALAASVLVALLLAPSLQLGPDTQSFSTKLGEQLTASFEDGSRVQLNTDTALTTLYSADQRLITLRRGEAFFEVAKDANRPFVVIAGHTTVRALGTAFSVTLRGEVSQVTVTEGVVRVTERNAPANRPAQSELLYRNQHIAGDGSGLTATDEVKAENLLAWREGKLVAEQMPLAELVDELSRYHPTRIFIADPGISGTPVSGVFKLEDLDSILLALEHTFEVRSVTLEDGSIQLIRAPL